MERQTKNATIKSTQLGGGDRGIMTSWVTVDYGGMEQGFGGFRLDSYDKQSNKCTPNICLAIWVQEILRVLEVSEWEKLKGTPIRVRCKDDSWSSPIVAIGHYLKDKWFEPEVAFFQRWEDK